MEQQPPLLIDPNNMIIELQDGVWVAVEVEAPAFQTRVEQFRTPSTISRIDSFERVVTVMEIPSYIWQTHIATRSIPSEEVDRVCWQKTKLTDWEAARQLSFALESLNQVMLTWEGVHPENPISSIHIHRFPMRVVSWNCQGAGNENFKRNFKDLVSSHRPHVVFLLETRVSREAAHRIAPTLGFSNFEIAPTDGMSGGVWMLWNSDQLHVDITLVEDQAIHAIVGPVKEERWLLTGLYAKPNKKDKTRLFSMLEEISKVVDIPWMVTGDWNEICFSHEKQGGRPVPLTQLMKFQQILDSCQIRDLGYQGPKFTWERNSVGGTKIRERLDRACANGPWIELYPENSVRNLPRTHSDHNPILIDTCGSSGPPANKPFRFEAMWFTDPGCEGVLRQVWEENPNIEHAIEKIPEAIVPWNKSCFGNIFQKKKKVLARIGGIQKLGERAHQDLKLLESNLIEEYNMILKQEETFWHQKSRVKWLKDGERNTQFFHHSTLERRKRNRILELKINGFWERDTEVLQAHTREFYSTLFTSNMDNLLQPDAMLRQSLPISRFQSRVRGEDQALLARVIDLEELRNVVFATHPLKAPGPDGLQGLFYQKCWTWIKSSLLDFMSRTFESRTIPANLCQAFLCLIPKVHQPSLISQYRPIALCNVIYKMVTKCITMRMRDLMHGLVAPTQSSFIKGRSTQDNIFLLQEVLHSLRSKRKNKVGCMILKLDLEKAYDKINWSFLRDTLSPSNSQNL